MNLFQQLGNKSLKVYDDISTFPVKVWMQIIDKSDPKYIIIDQEQRSSKHAEVVAAVAWENVYKQYIEKFHMKQKDINELRLQKNIALKRISAFLGSDKTQRLIAKASEESLKGQKSPSKSCLLYTSPSPRDS